MPDEPARLTPREAEVARLAGAGWPNRAIAARLGLAEKTVRDTLRHVYRKLPPRPGVHKRIAVVAWAERERAAAAKEDA